jgi:CRISPR-associated protein Cpf1
VYQKFEKMLIDKLNYLVFKEAKQTEAGGLMNALQLTSKFDSFKTMGKQSGFLYYVPAWNTSKIDPSTGFVNFLDTNYSSVENAIKFFSQFSHIHYNAKMDCFEFSFDYAKFTTKAEGSQTLWTVYTHGQERYRYNVQNKTSSKVNVGAELKALFSKYKIEFIHENNLVDDIIAVKEKDFHTKLLTFLSITLTLRQSISGTDVDFILSPVKNKSGHFFDSRISKSHEPIDSDANGAFHIALKGLWVLEQIKKAEDLNSLKLAISNKEWLQFAQARFK